MASCLGLYIETNLIKYAKVTKDRDLLKVEAFGVKFYDSIEEAIDQIVSETFSYKTPICINLSEEMYQYFYFFSLLNKTDLKKAIETEFESFCQDKGYNRNALETRYSITPDAQDKEKLKTIFISTNKTEINRKLQDMSGNTVSGIYPLPMCLSNIIEFNSKENALIINLEEKTTLTTIINGNIYSIDKLEEGMDNILYSINEKENSFAKAYEICKNTTIYTMDSKDLAQEENIYLEDIMPVLYSVVQKVKEFIENSVNSIDKIYITGTGTVINNLDLYFEEYFPNKKCEIIRPYFVSDNVKINIKDYIEVNSAIALAMQGLGSGIKNINFKAASFVDQLPDFLKLGAPKKEKKAPKEKAEGEGEETKKASNLKIGKFDFSKFDPSRFKFSKIDLSKMKFDWGAKFDRTERWLARTIASIIAFIVIYSTITIYLSTETEKKLSEVQDVISDTRSVQIGQIEKDIQKINNKTMEYNRMTENLKNYSEKVAENLRTKNVIPLLLTRIMNVIPKGVTITSIQNTTDSHIVINAQSEDYDLLGFFKGSLIVDGVLDPSTIISTSGVKQDGLIKIVIEGDLP